MDSDKLSDVCRQPAGTLTPLIDRTRCEGKAACVQVCPYHVFEIGVLGPAERAALPMLARLKAFAHGNRQAYAVHTESCRGCGLCVIACPEQAISLIRTPQ